ncbi:Uncharacterised protein [Bordetella pertussis]|nr:Uncharacterised protein [Bordetella pertussis]
MQHWCRVPARVARVRLDGAAGAPRLSARPAFSRFGSTTHEQYARCHLSGQRRCRAPKTAGTPCLSRLQDPSLHGADRGLRQLRGARLPPGDTERAACRHPYRRGAAARHRPAGGDHRDGSVRRQRKPYPHPAVRRRRACPRTSADWSWRPCCRPCCAASSRWRLCPRPPSLRAAPSRASTWAWRRSPWSRPWRRPTANGI